LASLAAINASSEEANADLTGFAGLAACDAAVNPAKSTINTAVVILMVVLGRWANKGI
jgi:hypothetical protein